ncbi:hypothetical protein FK515_30545, partial [Klebsiella pneumoniae]|nr:hypothetical protein [Klebsiella pneumoniae]
MRLAAPQPSRGGGAAGEGRREEGREGGRAEEGGRGGRTGRVRVCERGERQGKTAESKEKSAVEAQPRVGLRSIIFEQQKYL